MSLEKEMCVLKTQMMKSMTVLFSTRIGFSKKKKKKMNNICVIKNLAKRFAGT